MAPAAGRGSCEGPRGSSPVLLCPLHSSWGHTGLMHEFGRRRWGFSACRRQGSAGQEQALRKGSAFAQLCRPLGGRMPLGSPILQLCFIRVFISIGKANVPLPSGPSVHPVLNLGSSDHKSYQLRNTGWPVFLWKQKAG